MIDSGIHSGMYSGGHGWSAHLGACKLLKLRIAVKMMAVSTSFLRLQHHKAKSCKSCNFWQLQGS